MGDRVLELIIRAKDLTATQVGRFRRNWRGVERVLKDVTRAVVGTTAGLAAMVLGLERLDQRGSRVLAVKQAFARITDDEAEALERLREASRGQIDDFRLMALANQAVTLGAADTVEQFAEMVELSRALGRAQGLEATEALEKFTTALARQSALRADDLGLQLKGVEATKFQAEFMRQARQKADELTGGLEAAGGAGARFATAMANARDRLSEWIATSPEVAEFFGLLEGIVTGVTDAVVQQDWSTLGSILLEVGKMLGAKLAQGINLGLASLVRDGNVLTRLFGVDDRLRGMFRGNAAQAGAMAGRSGDRLRDLFAALAGNRASGGGSTPSVVRRGGSVDISGLPGVTDPGVYFNHRTGQRFGLLESPSLIPDTVSVPDVEAVGPNERQRRHHEFMRNTAQAQRSLEEMGEVAVSTMGAAAAAVIAGTDQIGASVINMITNIARSLPGVGGITGAVIGGLGGIAGALFGRRRDPVPVRMAEIDDRAAEKLKEPPREPMRVVTIIEQGGVEIERIERELYDRSQRDETVRFGRRGMGLGVR